MPFTFFFSTVKVIYKKKTIIIIILYFPNQLIREIFIFIIQFSLVDRFLFNWEVQNSFVCLCKSRLNVRTLTILQGLILVTTDTLTIKFTWVLSLFPNHHNILQGAQNELDIQLGKKRISEWNINKKFNLYAYRPFSKEQWVYILLRNS